MARIQAPTVMTNGGASYFVMQKVWASEDSCRVGILSDTHDLLRPEVIDELADSQVLLHIGDVCSQRILDDLASIAPVFAVRGNCDVGTWAEVLPETLDLEICGWRFHLAHDRSDLALDPSAAGVDIVLFGHSHKPHFEQRGDVVHLNPGSAGRRRFHLPVSLCRLHLTQEWATFDHIEWPDL